MIKCLHAVEGGWGENVTCLMSGVHGDGKIVPCEKYYKQKGKC